MKHLLFIFTSLIFAFGFASTASAQSQFGVIEDFQQSNSNAISLLSQQDPRISPAAMEVTSTSQGTVAFASFQTEMLDLDFFTGTDLGLLYFAPSANSSFSLSQGFYTFRLELDPTLGAVGLLIDKNGAVVQRTRMRIETMLFEPATGINSAQNPVDVEVRANNRNDIIGIGLHGDSCWIIGPGGSVHVETGPGGRCWIISVE